MKRSFVILLILSISVLSFTPKSVFAEETREETTGTDGTYKKESDDNEKDPVYSGRKCLNGKRACKVDEAIDQIESEFSALSDSYEGKSIWDSPSKPPPDASAGKKMASYVLLVPTYVFRLVTWPIAVVGDLMVKKGVIQKVVNVISNKERTRWVYPKLELGFGSGFGGGVGFRQYDIFGKNYELGASYQIHINLNQEAYVYFGTPDEFYFFGKPIGFKFRTDFIQHNEENYFGQGIQSSEGNEAKYGHDMIKTGGWFGYEIIDHLAVRGRMNFEFANSRHGNGGVSVEDRFAPSQLYSFGRDLYYMNVGVELTHDNRDSEVTPGRGGFRTLAFDRFQGLGTTKFDYNEYTLELCQFIPALMPRHTLVLRTEWKYQQQTGAVGIPFYRLTKIDVNAPMRGFTYSRFTDRGSAVFNVAYRFPIWKFMDGQIFFDTGRVFHEPSDFSFEHFKYDGGAGIRFRTDEFFLLRASVAYGGEGVKFLVKTSQEF